MYIAKTDYTLNRKNKDAIVCKTAVGNYVLLKREDFANDEEFEKWKAWSDEDYHISENATHHFCHDDLNLFPAHVHGFRNSFHFSHVWKPPIHLLPVRRRIWIVIRSGSFFRITSRPADRLFFLILF